MIAPSELTLIKAANQFGELDAHMTPFCTRQLTNVGCVVVAPKPVPGRGTPWKTTTQRNGAAGLAELPGLGAGRPATKAATAAGSGLPSSHAQQEAAVQLHQVPVLAAAIQPGMTEVMPEAVRPRAHPGLLSGSRHDLVDPVQGHRSFPAGPQP